MTSSSYSDLYISDGHFCLNGSLVSYSVYQLIIISASWSTQFIGPSCMLPICRDGSLAQTVRTWSISARHFLTSFMERRPMAMLIYRRLVLLMTTHLCLCWLSMTFGLWSIGAVWAFKPATMQMVSSMSVPSKTECRLTYRWPESEPADLKKIGLLIGICISQPEVWPEPAGQVLTKSRLTHELTQFLKNNL